jgi:hypothetical protein
MDEKQITIKFSHVLHESKLPDKDRLQFSEIINGILESIKEDVISSKGWVEVIESKNGKFSFLTACDDAQLKDKMNELISHSMPKLKED